MLRVNVIKSPSMKDALANDLFKIVFTQVCVIFYLILNNLFIQWIQTSHGAQLGDHSTIFMGHAAAVAGSQRASKQFGSFFIDTFSVMLTSLFFVCFC